MARTITAGTVTVDVLAPGHARLAEDLRRELSASGFVVVFVASTAPDWRADVRRLPGTQARQGVVVRADEQLMTVFTRLAGSESVQIHFEQRVDSHDRLARRRACLGVVESLRVLTESGQPSGAAAAAAEPPRSAAPGAPASPRAPAPPTEPVAPPSPRPMPPPSLSLAAPPSKHAAGSPSAPAGGATRSAGAPGGAVASPPVLGTAPAGGQGTVAPTPPRGDPSTAPAGATALTAPFPGAEPAIPDQGAQRHRPWQVGVGSTLGLEAAPGGPTGHLQFLGYLPLEWRLAICVRGLWPVLAGQFRSGGNDVRTWTFGGAVSALYLFDLGPTRLRPFVGAALGSRVALTETTPVNALQSRETFTPSLTLGAEAGVRYALGGRVQLFLELGVGRGWLIPGVRRVAYEETAANAAALRSSFGVMFEI